MEVLGLRLVDLFKIMVFILVLYGKVDLFVKFEYVQKYVFLILGVDILFIEGMGYDIFVIY